MLIIPGIIASSYPVVTSSYESIATVTVGSGGSSSISFSSISADYKHLQIRAISRAESGTQPAILMTFNGATTNYYWHGLEGNGSSAYAYAAGSANSAIYVYSVAGAGSYSSDIFSGHVIDVLDYANTNKYKTTRSLGGEDGNGLGYISLNSGLWQSTNAITSISLSVANGSNFAQYSQFALYGIKG